MGRTTLKWAFIISFASVVAVLLSGGSMMKGTLPLAPDNIFRSASTNLFPTADTLADQDIYQRYWLMDHVVLWGWDDQPRLESYTATLKFMTYSRSDLIADKGYGTPYKGLTQSQVTTLEQVQKYWGKIVNGDNFVLERIGLEF